MSFTHRLVRVLAGIGMLGSAACSGTVAHTTTPNGPVTITDSGSTNAPGFTLTVTPEGQASWHLEPAKNLPSPLACSATDGTTALDGTLTTKLFADLDAAEPFAARQFDLCGKSASFGTTTSVAYDGETIGDVECGSMTDPLAETLTTDTGTLENAVSAACK
jgi:hypothetical protein